MKSLFSNRTSALDALRDDVRKLGRDAAQVGREQVLTPAMTMAQDAQHALEQGLKNAQKTLGPKLAETRKILEKDAAKAQDMAVRQYDRTWAWISANPLSAIGLAVVAGFVLNSMGRRSRS